MTMKEVMNKLVKLVEHYDYTYHTLDSPVVSDEEYDRVYRELEKMEEDYPELTDSNSPTSRVGGTCLEGFEKVIHDPPMLSLAKAYTDEEVYEWNDRITKMLEGEDVKD